MGRANQVPELTPGKGAQTVGMLAGNQGVPDRMDRGGGDQVDGQVVDHGQCRLNPDRRQYGGLKLTWCVAYGR